MERFFNDPQILRQERQGPLGAYIDEFAQQLSEQGYSQQYACRQLRLVAELSHWLWQREWAVKDLTVTRVKNFLRHRVWPRPVRGGDAAGLRPFLGWLRQKGLVAAPVKPIERTAIGKLLDDFSSYLRQERALAPSTVANYVYLTKKFLTHRFGTGPVALSGLTAAQVVGWA